MNKKGVWDEIKNAALVMLVLVVVIGLLYYLVIKPTSPILGGKARYVEHLACKTKGQDLFNEGKKFVKTQVELEKNCDLCVLDADSDKYPDSCDFCLGGNDNIDRDGDNIPKDCDDHDDKSSSDPKKACDKDNNGREWNPDTKQCCIGAWSNNKCTPNSK